MMANQKNHLSSEKMLELLLHQSNYIDQLKREKDIINDELTIFKQRLFIVIEENQNLHDEAQSKLVANTLERSHTVLEAALLANKNLDGHLTNQIIENTFKNIKKDPPWKEDMHHLKALYESKIAALEAQLKTTTSSLKSALNETEMYKLQLTSNSIPKNFSKAQNKYKEPTNEINLPIIESLTQERDDLLKSVTTLRSSVSQAQVQEAELRSDLQKSFAALEDIQLQKTKVELENEQLNKAHQEACKKLDEEICNSQKRILDAAAQQRSACADEISCLQQKIGELLASLSHYENDIEAFSKEKSALMIHLDESRAQLFQTEKELARVKAEVEHEVRSALKGYSAAEQEVKDAKIKLEKELFRSQQDRIRYEQECLDLQRRLKEAEELFLKTQKLNVDLTQDVHNAKIQNGVLKQDLLEVNKTFSNQTDDLKKTNAEQINNLSLSMQQMELEYEKRLSDLEKISRKQAKLIIDLKNECKDFAESLNNLGQKYRIEVGDLTQKLELAKSRATRLDKQNKELSQQCVHHGQVHHQMQERLLEVNNRARVTTNQVLELLDKQQQDSKVNEALNKEVEYLHTHLLESNQDSLNF